MAQQHQTDPGQPYVVFGYAQSAVIENLEKAELENQKAQGQPVANVTFVEIGDARPHLDRNASDAIPGAAASSTGPASDQPAPDPRRHVGPTPSGTQMLHTSSAPTGHGSASAAAQRLLKRVVSGFITQQRIRARRKVSRRWPRPASKTLAV